MLIVHKNNNFYLFIYSFSYVCVTESDGFHRYNNEVGKMSVLFFYFSIMCTVIRKFISRADLGVKGFMCSAETGELKPCFDRCQLTIIWMHNSREVKYAINQGCVALSTY